MSAKSFEKSKLTIPYKIAGDIYVTPPLISVNNAKSPSYAEQTATLVHEYSHNMFAQTNPEHEHEYNKDPKLKDTDNLRYWHLYLNDPDEYLAHKEEIKFELRAGLSPD